MTAVTNCRRLRSTTSESAGLLLIYPSARLSIVLTSVTTQSWSAPQHLNHLQARHTSCKPCVYASSIAVVQEAIDREYCASPYLGKGPKHRDKDWNVLIGCSPSKHFMACAQNDQASDCCPSRTSPEESSNFDSTLSGSAPRCLILTCTRGAAPSTVFLGEYGCSIMSRQRPASSQSMNQRRCTHR